MGRSLEAVVNRIKAEETELRRRGIRHLLVLGSVARVNERRGPCRPLFDGGDRGGGEAPPGKRRLDLQQGGEALTTAVLLETIPDAPTRRRLRARVRLLAREAEKDRG